ncbi:CDP-glycerol glycerophosphotransferase [Raineyella antarctica]|uniref:CDP-glycerol glycerophosphotransferase n=1 Tax=Raineyella antarctica TaxID=1577474 RepID=A0A1G6GF76_9ACTN|nr:glycosyltransferase family 2 protein [Raineyella antarctica]SDB80620.1 CDP-glycerol glycerophosphotransferase [Raineyella antarctica]
MQFGAGQPRLSVVVPFYGVEAYIRDCLASIRDQSLRDIEVILVDDGSPDGSRVIAEEFCAEDPRFRIVTQENQGLGPARNTGTEEAVGEYLTFVDSDDLVSRHGFESMVDSLDHSGSSLAGGNAWRFNSSHVTASWAHRVAYARSREATHVLEFRDLARDRMVWNKVYRRSFWDEFGYRFPAIRYEDYPVTLAAHIDAVTVDCLAQTVYCWRERESGDSITQQVFRYDNLRDRITSAAMVLSVVDRSAPVLRPLVADLLADSDLLAVLQAFYRVPEDSAKDLMALGEELVDLLGARALRKRHPYDRLQVEAMRHGDLDLLRVLAERRDEGILGDLSRAHTVPPLGRLEYNYPGRDRPWTSTSLYRVPRRAVALRATVGSVEWVEGERPSLRLGGTAEIRHVPTTDRSSIAVRAIAGESSIPLEVRRSTAIDSHGNLAPVGFEVDVPLDHMRTWADSSDQLTFGVEVRSGRYHRTGILRATKPGSPRWPEFRRLDATLVAMPGQRGGWPYAITWHREPILLEGVDVRPDGVLLTLRAATARSKGDIVLAWSPGIPELRRPCDWHPDGAGAVGSVRLGFGELVAGADHDEPIPLTRVRSLSVVPDPPTEVDDEGAIVVRPLEPLLWGLAEGTIAVPRDGRVLRLSRTATSQVAVAETDLLATYADRVEVAGGVLVVEGRVTIGDPTAASLAWCHFPVGSDDPVDAGVRASVDGDRWSIRVPLRRLASFTSEDSVLGGDERLLWHLLEYNDGGARAVLVDPFAAGRLPVRFEGTAEDGHPLHGWVQGEPTLTQATGALRATIMRESEPERGSATVGRRPGLPWRKG